MRRFRIPRVVPAGLALARRMLTAPAAPAVAATTYAITGLERVALVVPLAKMETRGISIDLGFAYLPLDARKLIGFVDVPGHERFIRNMLAGVCGIDFALLAVAAVIGALGVVLGVRALDHGWAPAPKRLLAANTKSCGTFFVFRYFWTAALCAVPMLPKMATALSLSTSRRVCSTALGGL